MPGYISEPKVTLNIVPASQLASVGEQKVLIVGQQLAAGTAVSGALTQDHPNDGSENTLFGQRSHVAGMIREFKRINSKTRLDIIGLDDAVGTQATAIFAITGTATEDGTIDFVLGSDQQHKYSVAVTSGDTATEIGDALVVLTDADTNAPFTCVNVTGTVTATASQDGTLANDWDIRVEGTVAGVAVALTGWTGGATDPTLTSVLDVIANVRYQTIVWPNNWSLTLVEAELNSRFNLSNDVKDGVVVQAEVDTVANLKTYANQNSQSVVIIGNPIVNVATRIGAATPEFPDIIAARFAAVRSLRLTEDAPLTGVLTTASSSDQFGGIALATLPYHNTLLPYTGVTNPADFATAEELDELAAAGVSIVGPNQAFSATILGETVTTYLTNTQGASDTSYKYLNTVDTASNIREYFFNNLKSRYAQTRLTDGDLIAGRDMANNASIRAFCNQLYAQLADEALVQAGSAAQKDFDDNLVTTVTISTGTVTIDMAPLLVTQLRVVTGTIQINFSS